MVERRPLLDWLAHGMTEAHDWLGWLFYRVRRKLVKYLSRP